MQHGVFEAISTVDIRCESSGSTSRLRWAWTMDPTY